MYVNSEHPTYEKRNFYGPLELAPDVPQHGDRYFMRHPDDATKLVRASGEGAYSNKDDMDEQVFAAQQVLNGLREHGVNHVNPSYIEQMSENGEPYLITVVDKLEDIVSYEELIDGGGFDESKIYEADTALCHMIDYTLSVIQENGYYSSEMMRLNQFAYDESQVEGKRFILVDIEPINSHKIDTTEDSMEYGYPSMLTGMVARFCADSIELSNIAGRSLSCLEEAARVVEALPGDSPATNRVKEVLLTALDTLTVSPEMQREIVDGGLYDEEDEW